MYGKSFAAPDHEKPFQFSLRSVLLVMLGCAFLFALIFQWGITGLIVCWLLFSVGAMCYGTYWARWEWTIPGLMTLLVGACIPATETPRTPARQSLCSNNLKQIGFALHNYHDTYGSFPPACIADKNGRPMHSWRVLILPFIEQQNLYDQYRFDEPWDGPNNRLLASHISEIFRCPSDADAVRGATSYLAVVGPETMWPGDRSLSMSDIKDGTSATLMIVESHNSGIHWMEPRDLHTLQMPMTVNSPHGQGICSCHGSKGAIVQAVHADCSVCQLESNTPSATIRAALTIAGGD